MAALREYRPSDEETVVGLSLRAWEPVFDALGMRLNRICSSGCGDWRASQASEVRDVLAASRRRRKAPAR